MPSLPGPSSTLISRVDHLAQLLEHLPKSLPLNPAESRYDFGLDMEMVNEEGPWFAFNHNLEVCFETHNLRGGGTIVFRERGQHYNALIKMFKDTIKKLTSSLERDFLRETWLERLITAAQLQGAKIPTKGTKRAAFLTESNPPAPLAKRSQNDEGTLDLTTIDSDTSDDGNSITVPVHKPRVLIQLADDPKPLVHPVPTDGAVRQSTFEDMSWKILRTDEEKVAQHKHLAQEWEKSCENLKQEEDAEKAKKKRRERELAAERQRHHRALVKSQNPKKVRAKNINEVLCDDLDSDSGTLSRVDVAELSRPGSLKWKQERSGKRGGTKQERHSRTNWYHPFLWVHINSIAPKVLWSAQSITNALARAQPKLFSHLNKGTVQKWIDKDTKRASWSAATVRNVERRHALAGSGQTGVLAKYPVIVREIIDALRALRTSERIGLECMQRTCAAAHLPADAEDTCEECFFCLVYIMKWHNVLPKVDIVAKDEKHAYTLLVASTADGCFLPFQQVWAVRMDDALERGFNFAFAKSNKKTSHYSTVKTMQEVMLFYLVYGCLNDLILR
ncbi:hypothetical protein BJ138DRAFT_1107918 [Hygrophoropsis aurantiaca]|uniref:Uncharacterized protein n=1 Tax=Hygrophoropsis aurantiaca TaxID=72124 RepID=A0ACB7ZPY3_9AGAM|nr:hypothetical protein BJ138DRAFT_1107918 [Hygrophoropsis aurantiaca]